MPAKDLAASEGGRLCGAKTKGTGAPCRRFGNNKNGRCKLHGGRSTGPRTKEGKARVARNGIKHGLYSRHLTEDETNRLGAFSGELGRLDSEILMARVMLDRALKLAGAIAQGDDTTGFDLAELRQLKDRVTKTRKVETPKGTFVHTDTTENQKQEAIRRRPDPWVLVDRCLARVAHLERTRAEMLNSGAGGADNPDEVARKVMEAMDEIDGLSAPGWEAG